MSQPDWIISFIALGWLAGCYFFLFRKSDKTEAASARSDRDVIKFHSAETTQTPNQSEPNPEFPESVTLYTETASIAEPRTEPNPSLLSPSNDEDLIDLRSLSINIFKPE
jgi:hypothetical protein